MLGACFVACYCPGCCAIHRFTFPCVSIRYAWSRKSDSDDFGAIHRKRLVMGRELGLDMPATCAHPQPRSDRIAMSFCRALIWMSGRGHFSDMDGLTDNVGSWG